MPDGKDPLSHNQPLDKAGDAGSNNSPEYEVLGASRRILADASDKSSVNDQLDGPSVGSPTKTAKLGSVDASSSHPIDVVTEDAGIRPVSSRPEAVSPGNRRPEGASTAIPPSAGFNPNQNPGFQPPIRTDAPGSGSVQRAGTASALTPELVAQNAQDRRITPTPQTATDSSQFNKGIVSRPNPATSTGTNLERAAIYKAQQPQAPTGGQETPQPSWYQMRDPVARQAWAEAQAQTQSQSQAQKPAATAATAGTAVTDRPLSDRAATGWPGSAQAPASWPAGDRPAGDWPAAGRPSDDRNLADKPPVGRSGIDSSTQGQVADGKASESKPLPWTDDPDPTTRPGEIKPSDGKITYVGLTPDGREHPFGLAGRMFDGLTAGARGPEVGAKGDASDKISGKGPGAPPDGGSPGIVGQIFDGHGGWKPPVINSPFGDKSGAKTGDVENDKGSSKPAPMGGRIADTRIPDDRREGKIAGGKTPAEALIGIIESVKGGIGGGIRLGQFGKADQVGKTNKVDQQDPIGSPNKLTTSGRELTLTGVKTKAWPIAQDGSTITTVAMLTPFLSGANSGLRITKNITKGSTTDTVTRPIMIGSKLGPMLIGPDTKLDDSQFVGGDTVEMPHLNLKYVGDSPDREVEAGRLKSRPSVNMHLPGGTYAGSKEEAKAESGIHANAHPDAYAHASAQAEADATTEANGIIPPGKGAPALPWLSTGDNEIRDNSKTVVNIPAQAPLESMRSRRPAKAIDELESTLEMESPAKLVRERANAHLKEKAKEPSDELARNVSNELPEEQTNDRPPEPTSEQALGQLQNDDRYKYIVQQGDTVESVALNVLLDPMLAGLLFGINRRYVLPEEQYCLHPLMVGVVIQLPTPGEIIKFRQAQ